MTVKWDTLEKENIGDFKIFDLHWVKRKHPVWERESKFVVVNTPRWVNIIPVTKDNNIVLVEQYRHGIDELTLEVPGGLVEENEDPKEAGQRECTEETGFTSDTDAILLGENHPNPAFLTNTCYSYVWYGCEKKFDQNLDGNEDIRVVEIPLEEVKNYILTGKIKHSLVLTAFFFYFLKFE